MKFFLKSPHQSILNKIKDKAYRTLELDPFSKHKIRSLPNLERIGTQYGGWVVPTDLLDQKSVCYCAGVGEDISFDMGLLKRFNCRVYAFDPTPRAIEYVKNKVQGNPNYTFYDIGLWDKNEKLKFYAPADKDHVSHSILNLQKSKKYFVGRCKSLKEIMEENKHTKIDLLKLDIEGAEYKVIESIIADKLDIGIICVEYDEAHHPLDKRYGARIKKSLKSLLSLNYMIVHVEGNCNYTLVYN